MHPAGFGLVGYNPEFCIPVLTLTRMLLLPGLLSGLQVLCLSESIFNCRFYWLEAESASVLGREGCHGAAFRHPSVSLQRQPSSQSVFV